ncbi:MAG: hypothetical protein AABZ06_12305 [Bdellovibrionota bacterium]
MTLTRTSFITFLSILFLAIQHHSSYGAIEDPGSIKTSSPPCVDDSIAAGSRGCLSGLRPCSKVIKETLDVVREKVRKKTDYYYKGIDLDFSKPDALTSSGSIQTPVCNPGAGELHKNHLGQNCGEVVEITKHGVGSFHDDYGKMEIAYLQGSWIASLNCYTKQVANEIEAKKLRLSPACEGLGKDINKLFSNIPGKSTVFLSTAGRSVENLCQQPEIKTFTSSSVPDFCKNEAKARALPSDFAKHRVAACLLAGARSATESAFADLAVCEIVGRANASYTKHFLAEKAAAKIRLKKEILNPCSSGLAKKCVSCARKITKWRKCTEECTTSKVRNCYQAKFPSFAQQFVKSIYPESGACRD